MKKYVLILVFLIGFCKISNSQQKFSLQELIELANYKSKEDFDSLSIKYRYRMENDFSVDSSTKKYVLSFRNVQVGFRITQERTLFNSLSFHSSIDSFQLTFTTHSSIVGKYYLNEIIEESRNLSFQNIRVDTTLNANIEYILNESYKNLYFLKCSSSEKGDAHSPDKFFRRANRDIEYSITINKLLK
ncbi:MAG: hypothetical protein H7068_01295 [Pedobacter sp.]|nr:hypothetical protein [Chitinophagaceae bacterium]